jgi:hypothetical protein
MTLLLKPQKNKNMSDTPASNTPKRTLTDKLFTIFWFGGIFGFGLLLPLYFTMTETGTAAWLIKFQAWITMKLSGTEKWYPVATGLIACVIHVFALLGIVKAGSLLIGLFKK